MYGYLRKKPGDSRTMPASRNVLLSADNKPENEASSAPEHGHTSFGHKEHSHSSTGTAEFYFPLVRRKLGSVGIKPIRPVSHVSSTQLPDIPKENIVPAPIEEKDNQKQDGEIVEVEQVRSDPANAMNVCTLSEQVHSNSGTIQPTVQERNVQPAAQKEKADPDSQKAVVPKAEHTMPSYDDRKIAVSGKTYIVMKVIGRGGSSQVYQVVDVDLTEELALKVVHMDALDPETAKGYLNEVELLRKLQETSHVVKLYDFEYCKKEQKLFLVMERGSTDLATLLRNMREDQHLNPFLIRYYWKEMLKAVDCIHQNNIIHADLKPANFLLVGGQVKLIDFGIATSMQADMTSVLKESQAGTFNYMAPEAIKPDNFGYKISKKSDIWSLGCILYNMIYGRTPFQHITSQFAKLSAIVDENHVIAFPDCRDKGAVDVIRLCLNRNPRQRPDTQQLINHRFLNIDSYN